MNIRAEASRESLRVLSLKQWQFWKEQGYVVIKNTISREQAKKTASFLWEFEDKDPNDPKTWYTAPRSEIEMKELTGTGMVEAYNHQQLWNNRQTQKVYDAFVDVWGTQKLWVTIDRGNLNFPMRPGYYYKSFIHWDLDPETKPQNVQGVLALNDQTDEKMGGFQCIPWLYKKYASRLCFCFSKLISLARSIPGRMYLIGIILLLINKLSRFVLSLIAEMMIELIL